MKKQTLVQAIHLAYSRKGKALNRCLGFLAGCPVGGWGETDRAHRAIRDEMPLRSLRTYTVGQFVRAAYYLDHADRFRTRGQEDAMREAARIEAEQADPEAHGYTFAGWLAAAGRQDSASEYDLRAAWRAGEDPTEYAV